MKSPVSLKILLFVYIVYAALFIVRCSVIVGGERHFLLFDDAMVSMKYAKNVAEGNGLVWNASEKRVEGITNPAWTFLMVIPHIAGLPPSKTPLPIMILAVLLLTVNATLVYRITEMFTERGHWAALAAAGFTAFSYPLNHWSIAGMEVGLLATLVTLAVYLALHHSSKGWHLYAVLAGMTFVRIDAVVPALIIVLFHSRRQENPLRRRLLYGVSAIAVAIAVQTLARMIYYGDIVPNTYYLKMAGFPFWPRILRGLSVAAQWWGTSMAGLSMVIAAGFFLYKESRLGLPFMIIAGQVCYSIFVGGDAWEWWGESNRYITVALPMAFVLLGSSLGAMATWVRNRLPIIAQSRMFVGACILLLVSLFFVTNRRGDWEFLREVVLLKNPIHVYTQRQLLHTALSLDTLLTREATVAVVWAGLVPYVLDRPAIDILGKSDNVIARLPMRATEGGAELFYPGHMKYDYDYSIGELKPDVVVGRWGHWEEAVKAMRGEFVEVSVHGETVYVRRKSTKVKWDLVSLPQARAQETRRED